VKLKNPQVMPNAGLFDGRLLVFDELPSTNQWLLDHAAECRHGDAVRAVAQTAGRGRFGRQWLAPPDRALALSVLLRPEDPARLPAAWVGALAAVGIRNMLERHGLAGRLQWPNDVFVAGRKIAGILAEQDSASPSLVLGLGINVNLTDRDFAHRPLRQPATSMALEAHHDFDVPTVAADLLAALEAAIRAFDAEGPAWVLRQWSAYDALAKGQTIDVQTPDGPASGAYRGMDEDGRLVLAAADGEPRRYWSGDVSLRQAQYP